MLMRNAAAVMRDAAMTDAAAVMKDVRAKAENVTTTKRLIVIRANDAAVMDAGNPLAEEITSVTLQVRHHHHLRLAEAVEEVAEEDPEAEKAKDLARGRTTMKLVRVNPHLVMIQCHQARMPS